MAIVCPACGTENRSIAKFCIECIEPLPTGFARTRQMPAAPSEPPEDEMPSALAAFASAGPPSPLMPPIKLPTMPGDWPPGSRRKGRGKAIGAALLALLVVGAVGVLAVGEDLGGGRGEGGAAVQAAEITTTPHRQASGSVEAPASAVPAVVMPPERAPTAAEALAPGESIVADNLPAGRLQPLKPAAAPPAMAAATPVARPAVAAVQAASAPASTLPTVTGKLEQAEALFGRCDRLNFIAASRCRVDQCEQAANRQRKECQPVLAQQRLIEEKRNPTLAN